MVEAMMVCDPGYSRPAPPAVATHWSPRSFKSHESHSQKSAELVWGAVGQRWDRFKEPQGVLVDDGGWASLLRPSPPLSTLACTGVSRSQGCSGRGLPAVRWKGRGHFPPGPPFPLPPGTT